MTSITSLKVSCLECFPQTWSFSNFHILYFILDHKIVKVIELSSSQRSRARFDNYVTINPSGTKGGGMYRDMCRVFF